MLGAFISFVLEKLLVILPSWIARRLFSPAKIIKKIKVDLRNINPIDINFGSDIPTLSLGFQILNMSPLDLVLDRLIIEFWVGQPTLFGGAILVRREVPKTSSIDDLSFATTLTQPQQEQILRHVEGQLLKDTVRIYFHAYFESKVGLLHVENKIERRDIPVSAPPQVKHTPAP